MMETDCGGQVVGDRSQGTSVGIEEGVFKKMDEEEMEVGKGDKGWTMIRRPGAVGRAGRDPCREN